MNDLRMALSRCVWAKNGSGSNSQLYFALFGEKNVFEKGGCKLKILINHQI